MSAPSSSTNTTQPHSVSPAELQSSLSTSPPFLSHSSASTLDLVNLVSQKRGYQQTAMENEKEAAQVLSPSAEIFVKYKQGKVIGCGPHGKVYLCMAIGSGEKFAMKVTKLKIAEDTAEVQDKMAQRAATVEVLSILRHKHLVNLVGFERVADLHGVRYNLFMKHVAGMSVAKMLMKYGKFDECVIKNYCKQLVSAVRFLHYYGFVHGNINGKSLLVDCQGHLKLSELESVRLVSLNPDSKTTLALPQHAGFAARTSPLWTAPEVFLQSMDRGSDIWSIACTIIEMAQVKPPWFSGIEKKFNSYESAVKFIAMGNEVPTVPPQLSEQAKDFLRMCLKRDPRLRASINDLSQHPWLHGE